MFEIKAINTKLSSCMNLYKYYTNPKELNGYENNIVPILAFEYAGDVLNGPFPDGEDAIITDARVAGAYTEYVLKGPFKKGESIVATNGLASFWYATDVIKTPFTLGEPAIQKHSRALFREYLNFFDYCEDNTWNIQPN